MSQAKPIPAPRKDGWVPNPRDLAETPGGTIYATTPGGTRIVYNRETLLMLSKSPLSKSPMNLPAIPGITVRRDSNPSPLRTNGRDASHSNPPKPTEEDDTLFQLDK